MQVHAALLLVAVVLALATWRTDEPPAAGALIWEHDAADIVAVRYRSADRDVDIERRVDEAGEPYFWGVDVSRRAGLDSAAFPLGAHGTDVVEALATLRVPRVLGAAVLSRAAEFGLDDPSARIELELADTTLVIVVGDEVYGGRDRYAGSGSPLQTFVLSDAAVEPLELGEGALRERQLHRFGLRQVARVRLVGDGGRTFEREARRPSALADQAAWFAIGEERADPAFADVVERLERLAIEGFDDVPDVADAPPLVRVEYSDDQGRRLGFLELWRFGDDAPRYVVRSERTRVPALAVNLLAERVAESLRTLR